MKGQKTLLHWRVNNKIAKTSSTYHDENLLWLRWRPAKVGYMSGGFHGPSNNSQTCGNCLNIKMIWDDIMVSAGIKQLYLAIWRFQSVHGNGNCTWYWTVRWGPPDSLYQDEIEIIKIITITNTNLATHIFFLLQLFFAFAFRVTRFNGTEALAQSTW